MKGGYGALFSREATTFRVWATPKKQVDLVLEGEIFEMPAVPGREVRERRIDNVRAGARYGYRIDGQGPYPDVASRWQPDGVHGLSAVVDPGGFAWEDGGFAAPSLEHLVLYELHLGTFTEEGTFRAAAERLPYLQALGATAVELMPLADFPGRWNWGYDGVSLYAPARCYGTPDDFRHFVNEAHRQGLAVVLDVVYNHFGPEGAYHRLYTPLYFSDRHHTPWGEGLNFDGECSTHARAFFLDNALHWLREYHIDGFRLDAVHAMKDDGPRHILAELAAEVKRVSPRALVIAEDNRNERQLLLGPDAGGYGLDAVWADDLHHHMRRALAGDNDGYFAGYDGRLESIAATLRQGWFYQGQHYPYWGGPRGTSSEGLALARMVVCLQNHDQVGNRALGERLHHQIAEDRWLAASTILLLAPETPLLFMGQEWAASSPFLYFTDHPPELGRLVTEGRRKEFARFRAFSDEASRARIPDPQEEATFLSSKLHWQEQTHGAHARTLQWYRQLLGLRRRIVHQGLPFSCAARDSTLTMFWGEDLEARVRLDGGRITPGAQGHAVLACGSAEVSIR